MRDDERPISADVAPRAIEKGRRGEALSEEELTALFAEARPEVVEQMRVAASSPVSG